MEAWREEGWLREDAGFPERPGKPTKPSEGGPLTANRNKQTLLERIHYVKKNVNEKRHNKKILCKKMIKINRSFQNFLSETLKKHTKSVSEFILTALSFS